MFEAITHSPALLFGLVFLFNLTVGSFLNVVIYRLPKVIEAQWHAECAAFSDQSPDSSKTTTFNLIWPNSHCPKCQAPIRAWQNIPVLSYLLLKGRCASCYTPISVRYPLIELSTAALSVLVFWHFGPTTTALAANLLLWALICLTLIDFDTQLLPDNITLPFIWLGLSANAFGLFTSLEHALWGAIAGYLSLWCVFWLFKLLTGKEGMGYGDFKLLALLGAWMGWSSLPLIILLSSLVGALVGGALIAFRGRDRSIPIPFGPYLAAAGFIALLWGDQLINSYLQFAGLK